jgi:IS4 transposase
VFLDRGFDSWEVRDVVDRTQSTYVLGKSSPAEVDEENIEEIKEVEHSDTRIGYDTAEYEGREHDISYVYKPTDDDEEDYAIFTINDHVDAGRAEALIGQYAQRMEIENEYKSIKQNYLPRSASKDYRMRFLYFTVGVMMYNVWRIANFLLRDELDVDLGESPPILAGEMIELVAFCLFDPGG